MSYKVAAINNRGTDQVPFGFIYLMKGKHEAGRVGFGAHKDDPNPLAIWPCKETPDDINRLDAERMREALAKTFPHLAVKA